MHKNVTKCKPNIYQLVQNNHGASKIIGTFATYQRTNLSSLQVQGLRLSSNFLTILNRCYQPDSTPCRVGDHWSQTAPEEQYLQQAFGTHSSTATHWCYCVIIPYQKKSMPNWEILVWHNLNYYTSWSFVTFVHTLMRKWIILQCTVVYSRCF
jgi:hypothetical protein